MTVYATFVLQSSVYVFSSGLVAHKLYEEMERCVKIGVFILNSWSVQDGIFIQR